MGSWLETDQELCDRRSGFRLLSPMRPWPLKFGEEGSKTRPTSGELGGELNVGAEELLYLENEEG